MALALLLAGLAALLVGGGLLVRGAVGVAQRLSVPPLVIGLRATRAEGAGLLALYAGDVALTLR